MIHRVQELRRRIAELKLLQATEVHAVHENSLQQVDGGVVPLLHESSFVRAMARAAELHTAFLGAEHFSSRAVTALQLY